MEKSLEQQILEMIVERLDIDDVDVENFDYNQRIFASEDDEDDGGLGLDSVDALEIVVGLKKDFGVVVDEDERDAFESIQTLADYVRKKQAENADQTDAQDNDAQGQEHQETESDAQPEDPQDSSSEKPQETADKEDNSLS